MQKIILKYILLLLIPLASACFAGDDHFARAYQLLKKDPSLEHHAKLLDTFRKQYPDAAEFINNWFHEELTQEELALLINLAIFSPLLSPEVEKIDRQSIKVLSDFLHTTDTKYALTRETQILNTFYALGVLYYEKLEKEDDMLISCVNALKNNLKLCRSGACNIASGACNIAEPPKSFSIKPMEEVHNFPWRDQSLTAPVLVRLLVISHRMQPPVDGASLLLNKIIPALSEEEKKILGKNLHDILINLGRENTQVNVFFRVFIEMFMSEECTRHPGIIVEFFRDVVKYSKTSDKFIKWLSTFKQLETNEILLQPYNLMNSMEEAQATGCKKDLRLLTAEDFVPRPALHKKPYKKKKKTASQQPVSHKQANTRPPVAPEHAALSYFQPCDNPTPIAPELSPSDAISQLTELCSFQGTLTKAELKSRIDKLISSHSVSRFSRNSEYLKQLRQALDENQKAYEQACDNKPSRITEKAITKIKELDDMLEKLQTGTESDTTDRDKGIEMLAVIKNRFYNSWFMLNRFKAHDEHLQLCSDIKHIKMCSPCPDLTSEWPEELNSTLQSIAQPVLRGEIPAHPYHLQWPLLPEYVQDYTRQVIGYITKISDATPAGVIETAVYDNESLLPSLPPASISQDANLNRKEFGKDSEGLYQAIAYHQSVDTDKLSRSVTNLLVKAQESPGSSELTDIQGNVLRQANYGGYTFSGHAALLPLISWWFNQTVAVIVPEHDNSMKAIYFSDAGGQVESFSVDDKMLHDLYEKGTLLLENQGGVWGRIAWQ